MDVYNIYYPQPQNNKAWPASSVAIGNFDGVHQGHQKVIRKAKQVAAREGLLTGVMTFYPHPQEVLGKIDQPTYLTPLTDKLSLLEQMDVDVVYVIRFNLPFSKLSAEEFIKTFIIGLHIRHVVTGADFRFGQKGLGTTDILQYWGQKEHAFQVSTIPLLNQEEQKVSSTRIRELLEQGDVHEVGEQLGRPYTCTGVVIPGEKRGRTIGFPTANLRLHQAYVYPKEGVYAVQVTYKGRLYDGVLNLGRKPTFHERQDQPLFEVHLFHIDENLYGQSLKIHFIDYIRSEQKFSSVEKLKQQIQLDVEQAKHSLQTNCPPKVEQKKQTNKDH